ncbi:glycoside hydrolase family 95 protein [Mucilaginibacter myungsuensis]|uniref:Glycoside hydrolase family 95 protein n=1 Tax=Mucilaginibacter myungsuensis TaxID=649104 RepID=A0A929L3M7_9SPHI|nr:glycoside hydrolase family 95 protein [Mucilaginibacter myungsuensis]MBE9662626.1 glycoside hydrolase family 95 protein [Mucilaginibacter myungsuensis]MDN3598046.1 glycoside hydrolase family 95 protein [Mucilaginibacter myungsuensis]
MKISKMILGLVFVAAGQVAVAQTQPLKLWYNKPAPQWEGTLPLGNGRLGMTPDGGVEKEHIVLNDITLWSGAPQDANNYEAYKFLPQIRQLLSEGKNNEAQELIDKNFVCTGKGSGAPPFGCFQTLGSLDIAFSYPGDAKPAFTNYNRALSINDAIATATYKVEGVTYKREYFTSFGTDADLIRLTADKAGQLSFTLDLNRPERSKTIVANGMLQMSGQLESGNANGGMRYLTKVKPVIKGGSISVDGNKLVIKNATEVVIYVSTATDLKDPAYATKVDAIMAKAIKTPYAQEKTTHIANFQKLFNRVSLRIGNTPTPNIPTDERLSAYYSAPDKDTGLPSLFYQFGRYLTISSTRVGLLPPNLQGLWAKEIQTPWNGDYHLDVNVQMNHWPVEVSNLSELNLPLADLVKGMVAPGQRTAKAYYNADGWVAHVITNIWGFTEPGESASWGVTKAGSGWLCNNLWEHYLFSNDKKYLAQIYPILKGSAQFYNSMLVKNQKTGWLVTSPSSSPENTFYLPNGKTASICEGPTIDNQIIRELFNNVITASKTLGVDAGLRAELSRKLAQIPPPGVVSKTDGRLLEWLEDYKETDKQHRHVSHLYGLYPAPLITPESTPELAEACKKTLEDRGDDGPSWSIASKQLWWARLKDGNRAYKLFNQMMHSTEKTHINYGGGGGVYPNMLSAGPPFQIDGNFGASAGIAEMLIQSHAGFIELLPALPDAWKASGEVKGMKARGNFTVNFKWLNGKVISYQIKSTAGRLVKVKVNGKIKQVRAV